MSKTPIEKCLDSLAEACELKAAAVAKLPEARKVARLKRKLDKLRETCPHPSRYVNPYQWHQGYGRYVKGAYCELCRKYRAYHNMGAWTSKRPYCDMGV